MAKKNKAGRAELARMRSRGSRLEGRALSVDKVQAKDSVGRPAFCLGFVALGLDRSRSSDLFGPLGLCRGVPDRLVTRRHGWRRAHCAFKNRRRAWRLAVRSSGSAGVRLLGGIGLRP